MKRVRNVCRVLCILALMVTFTNCQNDTVTEMQQEEATEKAFPFKTTLLTKQDIEANSKLSNQMRSLKTLQSSSIGKSTYSDTYGFTVSDDVVKFIENAENNSHSYTFPIERTNTTGSELENLVFTYDVSLDDYTASLVTYHFSTAQKQEFIVNGHIASSSYEISYESISVNIDDVLVKSALPCTVTYQEFHEPLDSDNTFLYSTNGYVQNACEHENDDDNPCNTYTVIDIYCPEGGSGPGGTGDYTPPTNPGASTNGGGGNINNGSTPPNDANDTNDNHHDLVTSPVTKDELQEIIDELNDILGEGNWYLDDDQNDENLPSFDNPEELQEFINSLTEGNFEHELSESELNSVRTDTHRLTISDFWGIDIICTMKLKLPTEENGLDEMKILSMDTHLDGSNTLSNWTQISTQDTTDEVNGPHVDHYVSDGVGKQRISVFGRYRSGIKYKGVTIGTDRIIRVIISYFTDDVNAIDPIWSVWEYVG